MSKDSEKFWDFVHQNSVTDSLGEGDFSVMTRGFDQIFADRFSNAASYLDIGPGFGHALKKSNALVKGAMDISSVSLKKIQSQDPNIRIYLSTERPIESFQLVTAISVIQHCDCAAVKNILSFAWESLTTPGFFYTEGLVWDDKEEQERFLVNDMQAGAYSWSSERIIKEWEALGGRCTYKNLEKFDLNRTVWWLCLEK